MSTDPSVYDPQQAAHATWGLVPASDRVLTYDGVSITLAACLAGGIASVRVGGRELIYSGGHGASFVFDLHPWQDDESSEGYNPTESGSYADDRRDHSGTPPYPAHDAPLPPGPMHGPSSSRLSLVAPSWAAVDVLANGQRRVRASTRYAYYVPPFGDYTGYGNAKFSGPPGESLSRFTMSKECRLGPWKTAAGASIAQGFPFLGVRGSLSIDAGEPLVAKFDCVLIAYLQQFLSRQTGVGGAVWASEDDLYAFGLHGLQAAGTGEHELPFYYAARENGVPITQVTWYAANVGGPGRIDYEAYAVAGSGGWVRYVLGELRTGPPPLWV